MAAVNGETTESVAGSTNSNSQNSTEQDDSAKRREEAAEERYRKQQTKYFETKDEIKLKGLDSRQNYQFIARFRDPDGTFDQSFSTTANNEVYSGVRRLFDEVGDLRSGSEVRSYKPPTDPGQMLRDIIDEARESSRFDIYYDNDSIKNTDYNTQYTFRDQQLRNCIDKLRELCPSNWHWFVEADGRINLRGPQHTMTHVLRIGREVLEYSNDKTVKNVKNVVIVKGRQDEDNSEADGQGSIRVEIRDEESIAEYGARYLFFRDSNIKDFETARIVAQGRLEENNKVEEHGQVKVLDEKEVLYVDAPIQGYNVESFQPGDFVKILNSETDRSGVRMYWDRAFFNQASWESGSLDVETVGVPIKKVSYKGTTVELELSERRPSATGDFEKLVRWQRMQEQSTRD